MDINTLKDKRIAILGYGREGKSLVRFFSSQGIHVEVRDIIPAIVPIAMRGEPLPGYLSGLEKFDIIFRSPGIPRLTPEIVSAEKKGVEVSSATKLFFDLCPGKIIGVTGTKGKGTTAILIYNILKADGKKVFLGGNIGKPALDFIKEVTKDSHVILELSSFQLQDLHRSPHIAVVLDISVDHLDHHKTRAEYIEAKSNILKYQSEYDMAFLDGDSKTVKKIAENIKAKKYWFGKFDKILDIKFTNLKLVGEHNIKNAKAASLVAQIVGVKNEVIQKIVNEYQPREHRLEFVREKNGVKYYNDSASTISASTMAAIRSFKEPTVLILGGSEKNLEYDDLANFIIKYKIRGVVVMGDTGEKIKNLLRSKAYKGQLGAQAINMSDAVKKASNYSQSGFVVILSPASASFGLFKNFEDRGEQFKKAVRKLN
ncbi:MAG: UDP-N-acetylmuramoylalanine--D-glutamate ligase [Candidatus Doudnabacteria bacterium RIFCSPHIGHO2_01_FULL_43_23]|uniref:UDP-N-acetylmuramoylalanine--D-glutamate ligase n=1 Tax=Candidatus Doudnabacteria bacterium RIFCSPHIGHO2_01_FULL_43_23 TaxID=1817822 RepID=A0A1F5NQU8_9BACT|nr:MAG: UDP-N-acetylmuramoylalanine--D-glutamate ligase [Candidatus Doudnabacteria bacterium RIFCSPHIGHO2_01_FULL_43_23]